MEETVYRCPHGCNPKRPLDSLKKWKGHMTRAHGSWSSQELLDATGGDQEGVHIAGAGEFSDYKESLPEDANELRSDYVDPDAAAAEAVAQHRDNENRAKQRVTKDISREIQKLQEQLTGNGPRMLMASQGVNISDKENDLIETAFNLMFTLLNIQVDVEPLNFSIKNPLFIILSPFILCALIFGYHRVSDGQPTEGKDTVN